MIILFFFVSLDQFYSLLLPLQRRLVKILLRNHGLRVLILLLPQEMFLGLDSILDGLTYKRIGGGTLNVLNAEIAIVLLVLCRRVSLFRTLMIDDLLLGNNRAIAYPLEVLLMRWQKGVIALRHFRGVKRQSSVIEC